MAFFDIGSKFEFVVGTTQQMSYSAVRMKPDKKYLNFLGGFSSNYKGYEVTQY